jgi:phage/plasmid-associated DNA primase
MCGCDYSRETATESGYFAFEDKIFNFCNKCCTKIEAKTIKAINRKDVCDEQQL